MKWNEWKRRQKKIAFATLLWEIWKFFLGTFECKIYWKRKRREVRKETICWVVFTLILPFTCSKPSEYGKSLRKEFLAFKKFKFQFSIVLLWTQISTA